MNSSNRNMLGLSNLFNNILGSSGRRCGGASSFPFLTMCKRVENGPCPSVSFAIEKGSLFQTNSQG